MAIKETVFDVRRFGAKGDGVTDDSQAFMNMRDFVISQATIGYNVSNNPVTRFVMYVPAGQYLITQPGAMLASTSHAPNGFSAISLVWKGDGRVTTQIIYKPVCDPVVGAETFLFYNNDNFMHIKISDMAITTEKPNVNRKVSTLTVTAGATTTGNATLYVNGLPYIIPLTSGMDSAGVAQMASFAEPLGMKVHVSGSVVTFDESDSNVATTLNWDATGAQPEILTTQTLNPCTTSGNLNITLNGVTFPVAVLAGDTIITVAHKIRTTPMTGWILGGSGETVTYTSTTSGVKASHIATSNNGTGATNNGQIVALGTAGGANTGTTVTLAQGATLAIPQYVNSFFYSYGSNCAQNFIFERLEIGGGWKTCYQLEGGNIDSECQWNHCGISGGVEDGFLIGPNANGQFVNYNFYDCQFTVPEGNYMNLAQGGSVNVIGGSIMHFGSNMGGTFFTLGNTYTQYSLTVTAACTTSGNVTIKLDGIDMVVALNNATENSINNVATKIRNTQFPGWTLGQGKTADIVTFTRKVAKTNKYSFGYNAGTTGTTGSISDTTGGGGGLGASKFHCQGVRFEQPSPKSKMVDCYWAIGTVTFTGCDNSSQSFLSNVHGINSTYYLYGQSGPMITYRNCVLTGQHRYIYSGTGWQRSARVKYEDCDFWSAYDPSGFIIYKNIDQFVISPNSGSQPVINFEGCRSAQANNTNPSSQYRYLWDTAYGWNQNNRGLARKRVVQLANAGDHFPNLTNSEDVFLPLNAVITKATINIPAGATTSTTAAWHFYLGTYLETTLNGTITNVATSITLNVQALPVNGVNYFSTLTVPFDIIIGAEQLTVTAYNAITGVATVTRGVNATTAVSALDGAKVTTVPVILLNAIPTTADNPSLGFNSTIDLFAPCSSAVKRRVVLYCSSVVDANPAGYALIEYLA